LNFHGFAAGIPLSLEIGTDAATERGRKKFPGSFLYVCGGGSRPWALCFDQPLWVFMD
jgi:hypothetical protein